MLSGTACCPPPPTVCRSPSSDAGWGVCSVALVRFEGKALAPTLSFPSPVSIFIVHRTGLESCCGQCSRVAALLAAQLFPLQSFSHPQKHASSFSFAQFCITYSLELVCIHHSMLAQTSFSFFNLYMTKLRRLRSTSTRAKIPGSRVNYQKRRRGAPAWQASRLPPLLQGVQAAGAAAQSKRTERDPTCR